MKKLKLALIATVVLLFLGMGSANAQVKSVMISGHLWAVDREFSITTITPNYEKQENKYKRDKDFQITLKEEIDKWLLQGYEINSSSIASGSNVNYQIIYVLTKKE